MVHGKEQNDNLTLFTVSSLLPFPLIPQTVYKFPLASSVPFLTLIQMQYAMTLLFCRCILRKKEADFLSEIENPLLFTFYMSPSPFNTVAPLPLILSTRSRIH